MIGNRFQKPKMKADTKGQGFARHKELQTIGKKLPQDFANLMAHSKREDTRFENYFLETHGS